jgi:hypothetical protein
MIEKLSEFAKRSAASVSRREFLGRIGRGALIVATAAGGLLAASGEADAAHSSGGCPPKCFRRNGRCYCPR